MKLRKVGACTLLQDAFSAVMPSADFGVYLVRATCNRVLCKIYLLKSNFKLPVRSICLVHRFAAAWVRVRAAFGDG